MSNDIDRAMKITNQKPIERPIPNQSIFFYFLIWMILVIVVSKQNSCTT